MAQQTASPTLRVCYFGTYRKDYPRNRILIAGLRAQGVEVYECHHEFWIDFSDRERAALGGWLNPVFWWRILVSLVRLNALHAATPTYDVMVLGYPGLCDVYLGRVLSWWRRKPMVLDVLMSLHLIAEERGLTQRAFASGKILFLLEKVGLRLPDKLIIENNAYRNYLCDKYHMLSSHFHLVPHGADDRIFQPQPQNLERQPFRIAYHGLFLPAHSVETIVHAAALMENDKRFSFDFMGDGPEWLAVQSLIEELQLSNIRIHGWVETQELLERLATAHVCLGVFGMSKQSLLTIHNKIWESLAMGRPLISGDSEVVREALTHRKNVYLVERENPEALAIAIKELAENPDMCSRLSHEGYNHYKRYYSPAALGSTMASVLRLIAA